MTSAEPSADRLVPDPTGRPPLCPEPEFAALLADMVGAVAPRMFAIVLEYGDRVDARIAAWGLAFDDHTDVIGDDIRATVNDPVEALPLFNFGTHIQARLVWPCLDNGSEEQTSVH